jgi:NAD-dependent deacetylase
MMGLMDAAPLPPDLVAKLKTVRSVAAISGAGISADSGLPTYRGKGGVYDDPVAGDALMADLAASTLVREPDRTWRAIGALMRLAGEAAPNAGHRALAVIEEKAERFVLLTQNIDGLHRRAGSRNVIEIHGSGQMARCTACGTRCAIDAASSLERTPRCACGAMLRPDVVLFEERLDPADLERLDREFYQQVPDLVVIIGTSALFNYIVDPVLFAMDERKITVEINVERTIVSDHVSFFLQGTASEFLPAIAASLGTG